MVDLLPDIEPPLSEEVRVQLAGPCHCPDASACGAFTCEACLCLMPWCLGGSQALFGMADDVCDECWAKQHAGELS